MEMVTHAFTWAEIPVIDFDRAKQFYSQIFDFEMQSIELKGNMLGFLHFEQGKGVGGAIVKGEGYKPSNKGALVYLNGGADLQVVLDRIEPAGGKISASKFEIGPGIGFAAYFMDTEGNKLALHSMN